VRKIYKKRILLFFTLIFSTLVPRPKISNYQKMSICQQWLNKVYHSFTSFNMWVGTLAGSRKLSSTTYLHYCPYKNIIDWLLLLCLLLKMYVLAFKVRNHSTSSSHIQPLLECMSYRCLIKEALRKILSIVLVRMCKFLFNMSMVGLHDIEFIDKVKAELLLSTFVRCLQ